MGLLAVYPVCVQVLVWTNEAHSLWWESLAYTAAGIDSTMRRYEFMDVAPVARATVVRNIDDGVIVLDDDDRVVDINETGRRILQAEDRSVIGTHAGAALADYPEIWEYVADLERGRREVAVETDGGQRVYELQASPLQAGRRGPGGRLFLVHDVTDRKRRERELRRQNEQLDQFASLVSHDLRNPLSVTHGYAEAAIDAEDPETTTAYVEEVCRSHARMSEIIDDVLTLAREGRTVGEVEPTDLGVVARSAWENVDTGNATLVVERTREIRADGDRLLRAFENPFRNSVEHGSTGNRTESGDALARDGDGVTVRVGAMGSPDLRTVLEPERRGFYVEVDGPGIPADERQHVFEDGYTTATGWTGLSIVASIVEAHGWEIEVTQSEDGGARFEVRGVTLAGTGRELPGGGERAGREFEYEGSSVSTDPDDSTAGADDPVIDSE